MGNALPLVRGIAASVVPADNVPMTLTRAIWFAAFVVALAYVLT